MSLINLTFNSTSCFLQNNKIKITFNTSKDKTNITSKIKYQYRFLYTPILIQLDEASSSYALYENNRQLWNYSNWENANATFSNNLLSFTTTLPYIDYDAVIVYEIRAIDDINNSYSDSSSSNIIITFYNSENIFSISSLNLIQSQSQKIICDLNFSNYGLSNPHNINEVKNENSTHLNQLKKYLTAVGNFLTSTKYSFSYYISQNQSDMNNEIQLDNNFLLSNRPHINNKYSLEIPLTNNINIDLSYYIWIKLSIINNNSNINIFEKEKISNFKLLQPESDPLTIKKNGIQSGVNRKNIYQVGTGIFNHTNGVADKNGKSDLADSIALMDTHTKENSNTPVNEPSIGFYDNNYNKMQSISSKIIQGKNTFFFDTPNITNFGLLQENNTLYHTRKLSGECYNDTTLSSTSGMIQINSLPKNIFNKYCYSGNINEGLYLSIHNTKPNQNYVFFIYIYPTVDANISLEMDRVIILDKDGKTRQLHKNKWNLCAWIVNNGASDLPFYFSSSESGRYYASHVLTYNINSIYPKNNYSAGSINEQQKKEIIENFETQIKDENTPLLLENYIFKSIPDEENSVPIDHASSDSKYGIAASDKYGHIKIYDNINIEDYDEKSTLAMGGLKRAFNEKANLMHANEDGEIIGIAAQDKFGHVGIISRNTSYLTSTCNESNPKVPSYIYYGKNDIASEVNLNDPTYCQKSGTYSFTGGNYTKTNFPSDFFNTTSTTYGFILETKLGYSYYGSQFLYQTATNKIWYRCIRSYNLFSPWMRIVTSEISGNTSVENNDPIAKINPATNEIPYVEDGNWTLSVGNNHANSSNCKFHRVGKICQIFGWMTLTEALNSNYVFSGFPFTSVDNYQFLNITFQGGEGSAPEWNNKGNLYLTLSGKLAYMSSGSNGLTTLGNAYEWGRVNTIVRVNGTYIIKYS